MREDLIAYHDEGYIDYIANYFRTADKSKRLEKFGMGISADSPIFPNFYQFCQLVAGSSVLAAEILKEGRHDVVLDWMGGYHHAKKGRASGFCYVNDIVLGILRLLEKFDKVMYIDIDVHHGDGVEEAFASCNRVLTLSFHQFDEATKFFPGTGGVESIGRDEGVFTAVNVPLRPGCDSESFRHAFELIFDQTVRAFKPQAIWLQCGADSLVDDPIGSFRVGTRAHGACVKRVLDLGLPTVLCGGGGYRVENVARCWAFETAVANREDPPDQLPQGLYFADLFSASPLLHVPDPPRKDPGSEGLWRGRDTKSYNLFSDKNNLEKTLNAVLANVAKLENLVQNQITLKSQVDPLYARFVKDSDELQRQNDQSENS